ncbi:MAG: GNAT family N-acetyltransferase [Acetobacteraceae bacterium]|nr:GNAT family N-acetyltransferase [Acetobacteraceae bacterium]
MSPLEARPFDPAEAAVVSSWIHDEADAVAWGGPGVHYPLDESQWAQMLADPARTLWTPTLDGGLAGHFQLARDPRRNAVRLGRVAIAPGLRGRRLGTALARLACALAFRADPALHRVELQVYEHNAAARAAYAAAGLTTEGVMREDVPVRSNGQLAVWSTVIMAVLRPEWERNAPSSAPG